MGAAAVTILGPDSSRAIAPGVDWWICRCGRPTFAHSQRTRPNTGGRELVCSLTDSGRFEPAAAGWDYDENGLRPKEPASGRPVSPTPAADRPATPALRDLEARWGSVTWGVTGCRLFVDEDGRHCDRAAVLLWDAWGDVGIPACAECADTLLERIVARADFPDQAERLPPLSSW